MAHYEIEAYCTHNGRVPFQDWLEKLKDKTAQTKIYARLRRASYGHFGDSKEIKGTRGLYEMREHYGCGYRVFYSIIDRKIVLLLAGSTKQDQAKTIAKARDYLTDHRGRNEE
jgi:putative addiction module killer protein